MGEKYAKNARTLDMYERLREGKSIRKCEEAQRFGVDEGRFKEISMISGPFWMSDRCREMGGR